MSTETKVWLVLLIIEIYLIVNRIRDGYYG